MTLKAWPEPLTVTGETQGGAERQKFGLRYVFMKPIGNSNSDAGYAAGYTSPRPGGRGSKVLITDMNLGLLCI